MNGIFKLTALKLQNLFQGFDGEARRTAEIALPLKFSPIFIVGAPRSGSTVLYQFLVSNFKLMYLSNLMALAPRFIVTLARYSRSNMLSYRKILPSKYGYVEGLFAPNEGGAILRRWFENCSDTETARLVRNTVSLISLDAGSPMLFKNLNNSFRIDRILQVFPEARFIVMQRDPVEVAYSLLKSRRESGQVEEWFGPKPENYHTVQLLTPHEQVVWQALEVEKRAMVALEQKHVTPIKVSLPELRLEPKKLSTRIAVELGLEVKGELFTNGIVSIKSQESSLDLERIREAFVRRGT